MLCLFGVAFLIRPFFRFIVYTSRSGIGKRFQKFIGQWYAFKLSDKGSHRPIRMCVGVCTWISPKELVEFIHSGRSYVKFILTINATYYIIFYTFNCFLVSWTWQRISVLFYVISNCFFLLVLVLYIHTNIQE